MRLLADQLYFRTKIWHSRPFTDFVRQYLPACFQMNSGTAWIEPTGSAMSLMGQKATYPAPQRCVCFAPLKQTFFEAVSMSVKGEKQPSALCPLVVVVANPSGYSWPPKHDNFRLSGARLPVRVQND